MAEPLARVRIETDVPHLAWADGLRASAPESFVSLVGGKGERVRLTADMARDAGLAAKARAAALMLRERAAYTPNPPVSSRTPVSYRNLPSAARMLLARGIGLIQRRRSHRWAAFPGWPLDLSVDIWSDLACKVPVRLTEAIGGTPVLLTHDIDSPEGLQNLIDLFLPIEERHGARSCNFVVPCAWPLDAGLLRETQARGHEIAVHGYDHANRTPFAPPSERRDRLEAGKSFAANWGAIGYRAPSLLRTGALLEDLADLYRYDSSIPTSGGPFPVPNNGSATARPYKLDALWEFPLSLPRDGSLRFLGHAPPEIADLWWRCADQIAASGGLINLLTHCEVSFTGNREMLKAYGSLVEKLATDGRFRFVTPSELLAKLEQVEIEPCPS